MSDIDLYHRTSPEAAAAIMRTKRMTSKENGDVFFSTHRDSENSEGYGSAVVHVRVPEHIAELDDEFPDGEQHYRLNNRHLKPHHFVSVRRVTASGLSFTHAPVDTAEWKGGRIFADRADGKSAGMVEYHHTPQGVRYNEPSDRGVPEHGAAMVQELLRHHPDAQPKTVKQPEPERDHEGPWFHGTTAPNLKHVRPAGPRGRITFSSDTSREHAYATGDESNAWNYAEKAYLTHDRGRPRVYQVEPTGPVERDPSHDEHGRPRSNFSTDYRSKHPWRVVREVEPPSDSPWARKKKTGAVEKDPERLTFQHTEWETGGSKYPNKEMITAHHPDHGQVGHVTYLRGNRANSQILIDRLEVHPDHQRKGYGSALMDTMQQRYPKAKVNHGDRTDQGKAWWSSYGKGADSRGRTSALARGGMIRAAVIPPEERCPVCRGIGDEPNGSGSECMPCDGSGRRVTAGGVQVSWDHVHHDPSTWSDSYRGYARQKPHGAAVGQAQEHARDHIPTMNVDLGSTEDATGAMKHMMNRGGHPKADDSFVMKHSNPEWGQSQAFHSEGEPGVAIHPDRWDYGTLAHEVAHHLHEHELGYHPKSDEEAHGPDFARHYQNVLGSFGRDAGGVFEDAYHEALGRVHKHAAAPTKRLFGRTYGLDHRLFEGDQLRPDVTSYVLGTLDGFLRPLYGAGWQRWMRVYLAGSEASEWTSETLEGNNDFDILVGVHYDRARADVRVFRGSSDQAITDALNTQFRQDLIPRTDPVTITIDGQQTGPWSNTWYCNPGSWNIIDIKPYAAYDITNHSWAVRPPHLPDWDVSKFPEGHALVEMGEAYEQLIAAVFALPEPIRTQYGNALWTFLHSDRNRAFGPQGEGWYDPGNVMEKWLDQKGIWADLWQIHHRAEEDPSTLLAPANWSNNPGVPA
jgi:GNAT superfamily N-acetyltransferase